MSFFKKLFGKENKEKPQEGSLPWIDPTQNQWGIRLLDLRPITQKMLATSSDPQMAANAASYHAEDGTSFAGIEPVNNTLIAGNISIPIDSLLAPGVLFIPRTMEHKWAIYYHNNTLIFVRSWLRQVMVIANTIQRDNLLVIESITGKFTENEQPAFTRNLLTYLLASHALGEIVPAPLPPELATSTHDAGLWAFSMYGNMAHIGVFDEGFHLAITNPLRSHSLLHIAVARGAVDKMEEQVRLGVNLNLLAGDGLAPLHWSIAANNIAVMAKLLALGADPNVPSSEGATPIMNAVQSNKIRHLNLLIEARANINAKDNRGFTALHRAAEMGHIEVVKILLSNGADKTIAAEGYTALSFSEMRGNEEITKLLRE